MSLTFVAMHHSHPQLQVSSRTSWQVSDVFERESDILAQEEKAQRVLTEALDDSPNREGETAPSLDQRPEEEALSSELRRMTKLSSAITSERLAVLTPELAAVQDELEAAEEAHRELMRQLKQNKDDRGVSKSLLIFEVLVRFLVHLASQALAYAVADVAANLKAESQEAMKPAEEGSEGPQARITATRRRNAHCAAELTVELARREAGVAVWPYFDRSFRPLDTLWRSYAFAATGRQQVQRCQEVKEKLEALVQPIEEKDAWEVVDEKRGGLSGEDFLFGERQEGGSSWDASGLKSLFNGLAARAVGSGVASSTAGDMPVDDPFLLEGVDAAQQLTDLQQQAHSPSGPEDDFEDSRFKGFRRRPPPPPAHLAGPIRSEIDAGFETFMADLSAVPQAAPSQGVEKADADTVDRSPMHSDSVAKSPLVEGEELLKILSQASQKNSQRSKTQEVARPILSEGDSVTFLPTPPPRPPGGNPAPRRPPTSVAPERVVAAIASAVDKGVTSAPVPDTSPLSWLACQKHRMDRLLLGLQSASEDRAVASGS
eukprot:s2405_g5.t1